MLANRVKRLFSNDDREQALGDYVIDQAAAFARASGGDAEAVRSAAFIDAVKERTSIRQAGEAMQLLQTALMPNYAGNLYDYYRQQQYCMLAVFLGYAYRGPGTLASHIDPYETAARSGAPMRVLEYGAGIPWGLIHLLRTNPGAVRSVTLVDMDLIHVDLVEFILRQMTEVTVIRTRDPEVVPALPGPFDLCFAKDVFEHLLDPAAHLSAIIDAMAPASTLMLDINDHGERYLQHVSPILSPLAETVRARGYQREGRIGGITHFRRN